MATKINAADVMTMTFNADPFLASDEYDEEELQEMLDKAYITELSGDDAEQARVMLDYHADSNVRVFKGIMPDADGYYNGDVFFSASRAIALQPSTTLTHHLTARW